MSHVTQVSRLAVRFTDKQYYVRLNDVVNVRTEIRVAWHFEQKEDKVNKHFKVNRRIRYYKRFACFGELKNLSSNRTKLPKLTIRMNEPVSNKMPEPKKVGVWAEGTRIEAK